MGLGIARMRGGNRISSGWFGDGKDDVVIKSGQTQYLYTTEDTGQVYAEYRSLNIQRGGLLKVAQRCNGAIICVKNDLVIDGTISADKCAPLLNTAEDACAADIHIQLCGNLVGGNGGQGGSLSSGNGASLGGIGGNGFRFGGGYGGGGGSYRHGGDSEPRPPKGIQWPYPGSSGLVWPREDGQYGAGSGSFFEVSGQDWAGAVGGAAPGGSGAGLVYYDYPGDDKESYGIKGLDGDAYGGGALWIFVGGNVVIGKTGVISANGGSGARGVEYSVHRLDYYDDRYYLSGAGGGGGGGIVALVYSRALVNNGSVVANGAPGIRQVTDNFDTSSQGGANGTVLITPIAALL